jgi:hypothetical protein
MSCLGNKSVRVGIGSELIGPVTMGNGSGLGNMYLCRGLTMVLTEQKIQVNSHYKTKTTSY